MQNSNLYKLGAFLEPAPEGATKVTRHAIGGRSNLKGAVSPNSGKPLVQFAAFYVGSGEIECSAWKSPFITLLYSWTCGICEGPFSYRQDKDSVEVIQAYKGMGWADFPYPNYPEAFAEVRAVLVPLTDAQRVTIAALNTSTGKERSKLTRESNDLHVPRHQFGGMPCFLQYPPVVSQCPSCNKKMSFLATVGNCSYSDTLGFVGNDFVQIVYQVCIACNVITANQYAD